MLNAKLIAIVRLLFVMFLVFPANARFQKCADATVFEGEFRRHATKKVMPVFPADAQLQTSTSVAVAQVHLNADGTIKSISVLQAQRPSIAQAMTDAIKQWVFDFHATGDEDPLCINSKLTFYFVVEDKKTFVRNPKMFRDQ